MGLDRDATFGPALRRLGRNARTLVPPRLERRYRDSPAFRRRLHGALRWSFVPVLAWAFLFTDSGLAAIGMRLVRIQTLERQVSSLERRQTRLQREIDRRQNDRETLERMARERCGMAYPGEKVYRILEVSPRQARRIERRQHQLAKEREESSETPAAAEAGQAPRH
jgi:cell division protein FtsB